LSKAFQALPQYSFDVESLSVALSARRLPEACNSYFFRQFASLPEVSPESPRPVPAAAICPELAVQSGPFEIAKDQRAKRLSAGCASTTPAMDAKIFDPRHRPGKDARSAHIAY
jgi:hypothetical protein